MSKILSGIRGKLLLVALLPVFSSAISVFISLGQMESINATLNEIQGDILPSIQSLGDIRKTRLAIRANVLEAIVHQADPKVRIEKIDLAINEVTLLKKALEEYASTPLNEYEAKEFPELKKDLPEYYSNWEKLFAAAKTGTPESMGQVLVLIDGPLLKTGQRIATYAEKVTSLYNEQAVEAKKTADETHTRARHTMIGMAAASSVFLFVIMFFMSEGIVKRISGIATHLTSTGQQVRESIEQLSQAGVTLSHSSTSAAASLEETVASLEEMSSMVKMNSENAKQAATLSQSSRQSAERGEAEIKHLITSMHDISQSSRKIEEIINVIDDIAFQTNLLALNAAVEAARAGEQGKGFAVVAEAVRSLAQRSASAAKDISSLIKDSVGKIDTGTKIADQSGTVLSEIVNSVKKVADLNNEIATASSEQATGITQINKAMNDLDQSSQSNAASAEEIAATSGEIRVQAETVETEVLHLNQFVVGKNVPAKAA